MSPMLENNQDIKKFLKQIYSKLIKVPSIQSIDILAILAWIERYFYTFLCMRLDRVALALLSLLCKFENSTECSKISFDSDSFQNT